MYVTKLLCAPPLGDQISQLNRAKPGERAVRTMPFWRLHYHLVWATVARTALIDSVAERVIEQALYRKTRDLSITLHAVGNTEDHLHMVVSVPPKLALAEGLRQFKGASSYAVNHNIVRTPKFEWQDGYGALTIGGDALPSVVAYVRNQREHHRNHTMVATYERISEDEPG
jgi:putative transposase